MVDIKKKNPAKPVNTDKVSVETVRKQSKTVVAKKAAVEPKPAEKVGVSVTVYGLNGKAAGRTTLPSEMFGAKVNPILMAQAIRVYLAGQRRGTSSTKTRGEVAGTTKKIYRQKGTGRARHGAAKAPIFVGGGITFGPRPRDFTLALPKKMRKAALFSALTEKLQENKIKVLDLTLLTGKTKEMATTLKNLKLANEKVTVIVSGTGNATRATKNIDGTTVSSAASLNIFEILNSNAVVIAKDSIEVLKNTFLKEKVN